MFTLEVIEVQGFYMICYKDTTSLYNYGTLEKEAVIRP